METRRGKGEGAVHYDEQRARWVGRLDLGLDAAGKRRRLTVTATTKTGVAKLLRDRRKALEAGTDAHRAMTCAALFERWLLTAAPSRLKNASTLVNYGTMLDHANESIGAVLVAELDADRIDAMLARLAKAGYARATVSRVRQVVTQALRWGVARGYMQRDPTVGTVMPLKFGPGRTPRTLTREEAQKVFAAAGAHRLGVLVELMLVTGMRPGEATALDWEDVEENTVTIARAWKDSGAARRIGDPKGNPRRSIRKLTLPAEVVAALAGWKAKQAGERLAAGGTWPEEWRTLMFTSSAGTPIDGRNLRRTFTEVGDSADVQGFTPYSCRHTATSLGAADGVSVADLADSLGHADTRMVDHHYRHRLTPAAAPGSSLSR